MRMSKLMLPAVTVAGALALAGCGGGGGGTTPTVDNCATEALPFEGGDGNCYASETAYDTLVANRKAADEAIEAADEAAKALDADSTLEDVETVEGLIEDAETAIAKLPESEREAKMAGLDAADANVDLVTAVLGLTDRVTEETGRANANEATANRNQLIIDESRKAIQALDAAGTLRANAILASGGLSATSEGVNGSSQQVYANVMTALNARASIVLELAKANAAVTALEGIDTDGLSDAAEEVVTDAVAEAERRRNAISAILSPPTGTANLLKGAEDAVKGRTAPGTEPEKIARARAKVVADAMELRIAAKRITSGTLTTRSEPVAAVNDAYKKDVGDSGLKFSQIVGSETLKVTDLDDDFFTGIGTVAWTPASIDRNGSQPVNYNGIPGILSCTTAESAISACTFNNGKVTAGNVVFQPDSPSDIYSALTPDARYTAVQNAASYGYWLDDDTGQIHLHVRSLTDNDHHLLWTADTTPAAGDKPVEATYSGDAVGYSQRETGTGSDKVRHSGEFTAKVELKATFGAEVQTDGTGTWLDGTISGFAAADPSKGTDHVNTRWAVDLSRMGINSSTAGTDGGIPTDSGTALPNGGVQDLDSPDYRAGEIGATSGSWTAVPYGNPETNLPDRTHPTGFVGGFEARFGLADADGSAAGVYHAKK